MTYKELEPILPYLTRSGIKVTNLEQGFVQCPGKHLHTTPDAEGDCKLFDNGNGFFQLHCHHQSCRKLVQSTNNALAYIARKRPGGSSRNSASGVTAVSDAHAEKLLSDIFSSYAWSEEEISEASSAGIDEPVEEHYYQIFGLFGDDDIIWCGRDVRDTGSVKHACRFRPMLEWLTQPKCPGQFICPSAFKPKSYSRSIANVLTRRFLVVESDKLRREEIAAIFRWLEKGISLSLRAIVDTGGKSLHGWFDFPDTNVVAALQNWLPRFGCDPAMFNPAQPCRLPGAKRGDAYQRLIFIREREEVLP